MINTYLELCFSYNQFDKMLISQTILLLIKNIIFEKLNRNRTISIAYSIVREK